MSKDDDNENSVIRLVVKSNSDDHEGKSSEEKRDILVNFLREMADEIDEGDLPADQAVVILYKPDEDDTGFQFTPRTVGMRGTHAVALCELGKEVFIREMLG